MRQAFVIMVFISGIFVGLIFNFQGLSYKVVANVAYTTGHYVGFTDGCNFIEKKIKERIK